MRKYLAFTLAEILMVLSIIGIISAMTIPTLVKNSNEQITVVKLKKIYGTVSQAYQRLFLKDGPMDNWGVPSDVGEGSKFIAEKFKPYLKVTGEEGYLPLVDINHPDVQSATFDYYYRLADGMSIAFHSGVSNAVGENNFNCTINAGSGALSQTCAYVFVRMDKDPKVRNPGKDDFMFWITQNGRIIPVGSSMETRYPFSSRCLNSNDPIGCAAWVIYNGNMDYLKCNDLAWNVKTKCN